MREIRPRDGAHALVDGGLSVLLKPSDLPWCT
jgi:hypothetical protein